LFVLIKLCIFVFNFLLFHIYSSGKKQKKEKTKTKKIKKNPKTPTAFLTGGRLQAAAEWQQLPGS
jgi:uncharacterized alpha/beta hydrolase family protein